MYIHTYIHIHTHTYMCIYIYIYTCICIFIYLYIYIYFLPGRGPRAARASPWWATSARPVGSGLYKTLIVRIQLYTTSCIYNSWATSVGS